VSARPPFKISSGEFSASSGNAENSLGRPSSNSPAPRLYLIAPCWHAERSGVLRDHRGATGYALLFIGSSRRGKHPAACMCQ
jgi:hypothetical protein